MELFSVSVCKKYLPLIEALEDYYSPMSITGKTSSTVVLEVKKSKDIENVKIVICKGLYYNEHPEEYKNLDYSKCVFVKMTYTLSGEDFSILNAFPKNGDQKKMFISIVKAEDTKTAYWLDQQRQKKAEKKIMEDRRKQKEVQKVSDKEEKLDTFGVKLLTKKQKIGLLGIVCYLCSPVFTAADRAKGYCTILISFTQMLGLNGEDLLGVGKKQGTFLQIIVICNSI